MEDQRTVSQVAPDSVKQVSEQENMDQEARRNIREMLSYIGEDPDREGLSGTPDRVIRSYKELYAGYQQDPRKILSTSFQEGSCDEMVILRDVDFTSACEHHLLSFIGKVHIGYLPNRKVVGVSKLARLVDAFARRLQIQERMTKDIADSLMEVLQPKGCMVVVEAQHLCMKIRGVQKPNSHMITSAIRGDFKDPTVRSEFLAMIGKR